jgi:hypothetical protein
MSESQGLVPFREPGAVLNWEQSVQFAKAAALSKLYKGVDTAAQALIRIQMGRELGLGPAAAIKNIFPSGESIGFAAGFVAALVKKSRRYNYEIIEHTNEVCTIRFFEYDEPCGESRFTMEDARRAGLTKKDIWAKYPKALLFSRAITQGVRWYAPDVLHGYVAYTPDEVGLDPAPDDVIDAEVVEKAANNQ